MRRRTNERIIIACVVSTLKYSVGNVMISACLSGNRVGDIYRVTGIENQHGYHSITQRLGIPSGR